MLNITHTDDDGKCAGAIVMFEFCIVPMQYKYLYYNYKKALMIDETILDSDPDKRLFITDLSLCDVIIRVIELFSLHGWEIYHFDHHVATMRHPKLEAIKAMKNVHTFYAEGVSGCLLTYLYSCMNQEEREDPYSIKYDFSEMHTHLMINHREYRIPIAVRYIDDNDVWRHENPDTKLFTTAFSMYRKDPTSTLVQDPDKFLWEKVLYDERFIVELVNKGQLLYEYQEQQNAHVCKSAFESYTLDADHKCLCLNSIYGNSRLFGDKRFAYDLVCKFGFDGEEWIYTIYSNDKSPVDCCEIAQRFGGGGHKHAAGFRTKEMILEKITSGK